jgi:hypothetical protein
MFMQSLSTEDLDTVGQFLVLEDCGMVSGGALSAYIA